MATLFHALSGAVTGKVFLFDGTMKGWEVMEEVIRRRAGIIRVEWDPEERAQGDTHYHIARPSTGGRPGWKHLTPRQLIAHLVNDGAQAAIHRALHMELPRPLPQSAHEMAFIIVMNTPLTFDAYQACIAFSPVESCIREFDFLAWFPIHELKGAPVTARLSEKQDGKTISTAQYFFKLLSTEDEENEWIIHPPVPFPRNRPRPNRSRGARITTLTDSDTSVEHVKVEDLAPVSQNVRSPTPMVIDPPTAPTAPNAPTSPAASAASAAPAAPAEETEAVREVRKGMNHLHLGKRSRGSLSTSSYPASKHVRKDED